MNEIIVETNGQRYTGWTQIKVTRSIENMCAAFSFQASPSARTPFPVKLGQACRVFVADILFLTGWIEKINVNFDADTHTISVQGRDRTNDIVDSQIGNNIEFTSGSTLKMIVEKILKELNLSHINVIDRFNLKKFDDIETDSLGVTGFDFIERFAKKRQVLLTTNGDGDIVFQRANDETYNTVLSTEANTVGTIFKSNVVYDDTKRFNEYSVHGQTNNLAFLTETGIARAKARSNVNIVGKAVDNDIRESRKYFFQPEDNGVVDDNVQRAKWEANYRRSQSMIYTATLQGFKPLDDEGIWDINKLVRVIDEFSNINETNSTLLVTSVAFSQSVDDGSITTLTLKTKDAYTAIVNKPEKDKNDYKEGGFLIDRQSTEKSET